MAERDVPAALLERLGIGGGLTLVQHPVSPFCIAISATLDAGGVPYAVHNVEYGSRQAVIELTDGAYYAVPVVVDADRTPAVVVYETRDDTTDVARYVDEKYRLGLFPAELDGLHDLVVQYVESQIEDVGFRLDDIYFVPSIPDVLNRTMAIRHKERKFGKGCLAQWRAQREELQAKLVSLLDPLDRMLSRHSFLFGARPTYADYALYGVLGNYTFTGDNQLPSELAHLVRWHTALRAARLT